jgi:hypothetical protein
MTALPEHLVVGERLVNEGVQLVLDKASNFRSSK